MLVRLRVPSVEDPDFVVEMAQGTTAVIRLVGSADNAATEPLGSLLDTCHRELVDQRTEEVVVDVRGLDHMSASCLKQLLRWCGMQSEHPYRIRIQINPALIWQQSLHALACFDTHTISIET